MWRCLCSIALLAAACATQGPRRAGGGAPPSEGRSCETAVVIDADRESAGASKEGEWIAKHFPGSRVHSRSIISCHGHQTELVVVETTRGDVRLFFDISKYYGKF